MENNENFVTEQVTENVEQTTEQTPKLYTEEEFHAKVNEATGKRVARIEKRMKREYGDLISTLEAGTGKKGVKELDDTFRNYYGSKGVDVPAKTPEFSDKDREYLAERDANAIIAEGIEAVEEMTDYLASKGIEKMTAREKATFTILAQHRQNAEKNSEYAKLGVPAEVYNSEEFKALAKQFNSDTPATEVYGFYKLKYPTEKPKTMGSMKNVSSGDSGVKEFYTPEEARRFKQSEVNSNPALAAAIEASMLKWRK